jgi:hypothetical protein
VKSWSDSPFDHQVAYGTVRGQAAVLGDNAGEARVVYEIAGHPGWLAKLYKKPLAPADADVLDRIIALPESMTPEDRGLVDQQTAWPVARITENGKTVGVAFAKAPQRFFASLRLRGGRTSPARPLPVDWLMWPSERVQARGLVVPTPEIRRRAAMDFLRIGDLFARNNLVYGDWSYHNALWDQHNGRVFLIDIDSCGIGARVRIESPDWEDALYTDRHELDAFSDYYKVALAVARCLTGCREPEAIMAGVGQGAFRLALHRALLSTAPDRRTPPGELLKALKDLPSPTMTTAAGTTTTPTTTGGDNVTGFRPVRSRTRRGPQRAYPPSPPGTAPPGRRQQPASVRTPYGAPPPAFRPPSPPPVWAQSQDHVRYQLRRLWEKIPGPLLVKLGLLWIMLNILASMCEAVN